MDTRIRLLILVATSITLVACATAYDKKGIYHRVRKGESIGKVARYYHVPVQDLAEWNNIEDPSEILPGLKLYIPRVERKRPSWHKKLPYEKEEIIKTGREVVKTEKIDVPIVFDRSRFIWPVEGSLISPFGIRNGRRHDGVDVKAEDGTPIKAAAGGEVVFDSALKGYGNMVILRHEDRFFTVYAHNSKNKVKKGQRVAKGEVVGYVGRTGRASGPHIHFEVRQGEKARNPLFFLPAVGDVGVGVAKKGEGTAKRFAKRGVAAATGSKEKKDVEDGKRRRVMKARRKIDE